LIARGGGTNLEGPGPPSVSPLDLLAYAFMPVEAERHGVAVEAPPDWSFEPSAVDPRADVVVWGRTPEGSVPLASAARRAGQREVSLRTLGRRLPARLRVVAVHRLPPRPLGLRRLRGGVRAALRGGALVELATSASGARVLDAVAEASRVSVPGRGFHAGAGGALLVRGFLPDGSGAVLRVARAGSAGDPAGLADTLERLGRDRVQLAPRLLARGTTAGASWLAEAALPGRRPTHASGSLTRQVAELCASFPRSGRPPTATAADLAAVAAVLPDRAGSIDEVSSQVSGPLQTLPSVLRHGDLWAGNLLVDRRGRLSGLVDWDAAHPEAAPGADLLQLVATEFRRKTHRALGQAFLERPWLLPEFADATAGYWPSVGVQPDDDVLGAVGIAWWATEVHGTLARLPHRATDGRWLETNVDRVLTRLAS
jgi:aminoglycoside phosphotransferase